MNRRTLFSAALGALCAPLAKLLPAPRRPFTELQVSQHTTRLDQAVIPADRIRVYRNGGTLVPGSDRWEWVLVPESDLLRPQVLQ